LLQTATKAAQLAEATGATVDDDDEEAVQKQHTYSYWAIDFPRMYDMAQLRLTVMRKLIKDEVDAREVLAKYMCKAPQCGREYTSFDMPDLIQMDGAMQCTMCQGVVEQVGGEGRGRELELGEVSARSKSQPVQPEVAACLG
jgi:transcription initiation factor IIE alpha subunit